MLELEDAVDLAAKTWTGNGRIELEELETDDKLARACEKAPLDDPVLQALRDAYNAMVKEYKVCSSLVFGALSAEAPLPPNSCAPSPAHSRFPAPSPSPHPY